MRPRNPRLPLPGCPTGTGSSLSNPSKLPRWPATRSLVEASLRRLAIVEAQLFQLVLAPGKSLLWKIPLLTLTSLLPLALLLVLVLVLNLF